MSLVTFGWIDRNDLLRVLHGLADNLDYCVNQSPTPDTLARAAGYYEALQAVAGAVGSTIADTCTGTAPLHRRLELMEAQRHVQPWWLTDEQWAEVVERRG